MNSAQRLEENLRRLDALRGLTQETSNGISRNRDRAKGKVRLKWNHKVSTNVTQYRIDKIATQSLTTSTIEPDPVDLPIEELRHKHYRMI